MSGKILKNSTEVFLNNMIFHGASSAAVMIYQHGKLKHYESSSHKWHDFYSTAPESLNCHIARTGIELARQKKDFSIIWDATQANNDESLYLNEERERFDHCHGISICESLPDDTALGIILTGRRCDVNFAELVIKNKQNLQKHINFLKVTTNLYNNISFS